MKLCFAKVITIIKQVAILALCESDEADPQANRAEPKKRVLAYGP